MPESIALTGVTGELGSRVARHLRSGDLPLRLIARRPDQIPDDLVGDVATAAYQDPTAMRQALAGVDTLFLVSAREAEDRLEHHRLAVEAAAEAGVERVVYTSFLNASPDSTFTLGRQHFHTEEFIRASGMRYVFLRNSLYADFLPFFTGDDGVIRAPAGDGRTSFVTRDDIAEVAAAVLLDDSFDGAALAVTGPEAISLAEAAERMSAVIGRRITYVPETEEEAYESRSVYGAPDWEVEGWVTSYLAIANGEMEEVSDTVERITGHPPRTIEEQLRSHPGSYRHLLGEQG